MTMILEGTGQQLAKAREAKGWSQAEVAARLKISVGQVAAIEAEDASRLPPLAFLRGFLRSYAHLVDLDPDVLVVSEGIQRATPETISVPSTGVAMPMGRFKKWLVMIPVLGGVFFLLVIGIFMWLKQGSGSASMVESVPLQAVPKAVSPAASVSLPAALPASPPPPAVSDSKPVVSVPGELRFTTREAAWIQVTDASGNKDRRLIKPDSPEVMTGRPPFELVVGNASSVSLEYNGRRVDLHPLTTDRVARLTLE